MRYGSVCSGIESASVAWEPLGWEPSWFSEIEEFPSAVLNHRWPDVENIGDMTKIRHRVMFGETESPDVLVGGTPCQAFSVAGMRGGLADERGQLTLEFVELADAIDDFRIRSGKPESIIVWENVPGVLSDKSNAFGCFLGALAGEDRELQPSGKKWTNAGCVYGPQRAIAWRILDAQYFGVAQRRRRVFVVASARADIDPAAVLFERESMRRDTPPSRKQKQDAAQDAGSRIKRPSHWEVGLHPTLNQSHNTGGIGASNQELFSQRGAGIVGQAISIQGSMIGRNEKNGPSGSGVNEDVSFTLNTIDRHAVAIQNATRGKSQNGLGVASPGEPMYTLDQGSQHGVACALAAQPGMKQTCYVNERLAVRRLTPTECERLQGFPDGHTAVPYRNKPACDGPRYKAIGNSMAVPVMRWIGERIEANRL